MELIFILTYNVEKDTFETLGNVPDDRKKEFVVDFLRFTFNLPKDRSPVKKRKKYNIRISLDLNEWDGDGYSVTNNCGNTALRDGILLHYISENKKMFEEFLKEEEFKIEL